MNSHETTRELDAARVTYHGKIIPKPALAVMDAETERDQGWKPTRNR